MLNTADPINANKYIVYKADTTTQGLQNVIFSVFMVSTIFSTLVQQVRLHCIE